MSIGLDAPDVAWVGPSEAIESIGGSGRVDGVDRKAQRQTKRRFRSSTS